MLGLVANSMAFSPPTIAVPDTGPTVDNEVENCTSTDQAFDITKTVVAEANISDLSAFGQASGRETVLMRSDHSVPSICYTLDFNVNDKYGSDLDGVLSGERVPWCTSTDQTKLGVHFGSSGHFGSSSAALHQGQMTLNQKLLWTQVPAFCRRY